MFEALKPKIRWEEISDNYARVMVEPLERGFGYTLGNSLRRVLLSSLTGVAITSVKIEGVSHEFSNLPGVKEDVIHILLNLKEVVIKSDLEEAVLRLKAKGPAKIKAGDFEVPAGVEIVNPDTPIATLNEKASLEMMAKVSRGRGYVTAEKNRDPDSPIGEIPLDSNFSPVKRVSYKVEETRVGQQTDYDRLTLEIETNGAIKPVEAANHAAQILKGHLDLFIRASEEIPVMFRDVKVQSESIYSTPLEQLELSARSYNCLKKEGVDTVEQLLELSEDELSRIRNMGQKSVQEVKEKLSKLGLTLKS